MRFIPISNPSSIAACEEKELDLKQDSWGILVFFSKKKNIFLEIYL